MERMKERMKNKWGRRKDGRKVEQTDFRIAERGAKQEEKEMPNMCMNQHRPLATSLRFNLSQTIHRLYHQHETREAV